MGERGALILIVFIVFLFAYLPRIKYLSRDCWLDLVELFVIFFLFWQNFAFLFLLWQKHEKYVFLFLNGSMFWKYPGPNPGHFLTYKKLNVCLIKLIASFSYYICTPYITHSLFSAETLFFFHIGRSVFCQ